VSPQEADRALASAIAQAIDALEREPDQGRRARWSVRMADRMRHAQEQFGDQRTLAFEWLRENEGWSLRDLAIEFGITRARAAQIAVRDRYKDARRRV
jgi:hypothetical protein